MQRPLGSAIAVLLTAVSASAGETELLNALGALEGHIDGTATLTGAQIATHQAAVISNASFFGDSAATITASFDLVTAYENAPAYGPMWGAGTPTQNGFNRNNDNTQDINWTVYQVMQGIMDDTYNSANLATHGGLISGYAFQSGDVFPGPVNAPINPGVHNVSIDGSFIDTAGRDTQHWERPAVKATGTTLVPGSVATITVPASIVNKGYQIQVGTHYWDMSSRPAVDRLDRSKVLYDIDSTSLDIASPIGGNIYVLVPKGEDAGVINVGIQNAARSPFFSMQDHHTTTLADWQTIERNHASPWTDFQTEKVLMQVPTGWVYQFDDPKTALEAWEAAADVTNMLMGFPTDRGKETIYNQVDVRFRASVFAPGYPAVNATYDPLNNQDASGWNTSGSAYNGNSNQHFVIGPENAPDWEFHELGHYYRFPKFGGETEAAVNLLHVAVMQQAFGKSWDEAFAGSRGFAGNPNRTIDNTAVAWMTSFNFAPRRVPMASGEKSYQLKGHAKFVEYARLFGWEKLGDYYKDMMDDGYNNSPSPSTDGHLERLSIAAGVDVVPLMHFWGIHPSDYAALQTEFDTQGIGKSRDIFDLLMHYKSLVPEDNAAFQAFALGWWGNQPSPNGFWTESEHARYFDQSVLWPGENDSQQWADITVNEEYNEAVAAEIRGTIHDLLLLYFPEFLADLDEDGSVTAADWVIFITNAQTDLSGLTAEQAWALGDLDGDFDNDIYDFDLFRKAYELENPAPGAFAAMVASTSVPEPGSLGLLAGAGLITLRRRRTVKGPH